MAKSSKKGKKNSRDVDGNLCLAENRLARHQYEILEAFETGIELLGTEVKSIRAGNANLRDGFCLIRKGELQLHNVHISPLKHAGIFFNHDPLRIKKLLAHRKEIDKLQIQLERKGLSLIPLKIYLKGSWIKLSLGLGKGRKLHDKREDAKKKENAKEIKSIMKRY